MKYKLNWLVITFEVFIIIIISGGVCVFAGAHK